MLPRNMKKPMRIFSRPLCALLPLLFCAVILTLLFPPDTFSAGGSASHSGKKRFSSRSSTPVAKSTIPSGLVISPDLDEFSQNPKLLNRILRGPHGYFRFINEIFAEEVCVRLRDGLGWIPNVSLQGDAHLENYAITERGRGLTDFDAATIGPVVLDLVRFGVSIHLASQANGWEEEAEPIVDSFLSGYRAALDNEGLACSSLHWLLVKPGGLSITSDDPAVRQTTIDVMKGLVALAAELGGEVLVHGSPAQRMLSEAEPAVSRGYAMEFFAAAAEASAVRIWSTSSGVNPATRSAGSARSARTNSGSKKSSTSGDAVSRITTMSSSTAG